MTMPAQLRVVPNGTAPEGKALLGWLKLLGWAVVIDHDDGHWVGFASRIDTLGAELYISESASSQRELVSKLLSSARGYASRAA